MSAIVLVVYKEVSEDELHYYNDTQIDPIVKQFRKEKPVEEVRNSIIKHGLSMSHKAFDRNVKINLQKENQLVEQFLSFADGKGSLQVIIVPGFMPPTLKPVQLHRIAKKRLNLAMKEFLQYPRAIFIVTGGNVKPSQTPYNEAMEMKRHLMATHEVPEFLIAIEPFAQNTVTNFRKVGINQIFSD